jgi:hypothetical protein
MAVSGTSGEEGHVPGEELLDGEEETLWALGGDSDEEIIGEDEDVDHHQNPINLRDQLTTMRTVVPRSASGRETDEHALLVGPDLEFSDYDRDRRRGTGINRAGSSRSSFRGR